MITESPKRMTQMYWKRGNSYSLCFFKRLHEIPLRIGGSLKAVTVLHAGEERILKPEEVYGTYKEMFCEKHKLIIAALVAKGKESMTAISKRLLVPYSRVLSVNKQVKELGIINEAEEKV